MVKSPHRKAVSKFWLSAVGLIMVSACTSAQNPHPKTPPKPADGPALWKVTDQDTTLYMFGFASVLKPDTPWKTDGVTQAFDAAQLVLVETDAATPEAQAAAQQTIQRIGLYQDGRSLSSVLTDDQRQAVDAVSKPMGAPITALNALRPWLASIQIGILDLSRKGYDLANAPAVTLVADARQAGKTVRALEGPTDLMERISDLPETEHVNMLLHAVKGLQDDPEHLDRVNTAWLAGDVKRVADLLHGEGAWASEAVYNTMLVKRNAEWSAEITNVMRTEPGVIFVAVGLGHVAGEYSLVGQLKANGLQVERQ